MAANRQSIFESLTINLEHDIDEQYQYQPGEIIRGKICLHLFRSTLVQTVFLTITGEAICAWEDEYGGQMQSSENYIDATQAVFNEKGKACYLDKGNHEFPFEYQLPENIPSSFIGKFGSVTYILKAVVQGEKPGETSIATEPFLVMRKYILPEETAEPKELSVAKTYFAMCSWGKVKANIGLNQTGFVPGDDIMLQAEVHNRSPVRITAIQGALIMISNYRAQKNVSSFRQIVNKRRDDFELLDGDSRRWQNVRINIPAYVPESRLDCCDIIDLRYIFQYRVELAGGKELKIEVPLLIGANPKGLSIPENRDDTVNTHWTMGPRALAKQHMEDLRELQNKWTVESPEFRQDNTQVVNPLFRQDSEKLRNGDKPYHQKSRKMSDEFDDIDPDYHHRHTKM